MGRIDAEDFLYGVGRVRNPDFFPREEVELRGSAYLSRKILDVSEGVEKLILEGELK